MFKKIFIILLIGGLLACSPKVADHNTHIRFCIPNNMVSAVVAVAQAQGYFTEEKITLEPQIVTNGKMANDLLLANQADMAAGADGPLTWLSFGQHPLRILAETHNDFETGIFANRQAGIKTEDDLVGKNLGYLPGTVSFLYLAELMEKKGWTLKDFKLVPLQPPAMPQALAGKQIDAFVMWEPWGYNAVKQLGTNGLVLRQKDLYHFTSLLVSREDFINKNPEATKGVIRALIKAEKFIAQNPDQAINIWAKAFKLDPEYLRDNQDLYQFKVQLSHKLLTKLNRNVAMIKKYMSDYAEKAAPNFAPLILDKYLHEVDHTRVEVK